MATTLELVFGLSQMFLLLLAKHDRLQWLLAAKGRNRHHQRIIQDEFLPSFFPSLLPSFRLSRPREKDICLSPETKCKHKRAKRGACEIICCVISDLISLWQSVKCVLSKLKRILSSSARSRVPGFPWNNLEIYDMKSKYTEMTPSLLLCVPIWLHVDNSGYIFPNLVG